MAEQALAERDRTVHPSISDALDGNASRIYAISEKPGSGSGDEELVLEMIRLRFGFEGEEARDYLAGVEKNMRQ